MTQPGLSEQPWPGTPEYDRLQSELAFAIEDSGNTREAAGRAILKIMVGRGFWPLGTQVRVTKRYKVKAKFPPLP